MRPRLELFGEVLMTYYCVCPLMDVFTPALTCLDITAIISICYPLCMYITHLLTLLLPFLELFFSTHSLRIGGMSCGTAAQIPNSTLCRIGGWHGNSEALHRSNVPDHGILSALDAHLLDTKVTLLSSAEVRVMLPTASQFS